MYKSYKFKNGWEVGFNIYSIPWFDFGVAVSVGKSFAIAILSASLGFFCISFFVERYA